MVWEKERSILCGSNGGFSPEYKKPKSSPATELKQASNHDAEDNAQELADRFHADVEAKKSQRTPLVLAQTAETNLESLVALLNKSEIMPDKKPEIIRSIKKTIKLADEAQTKLSG